MKDIKIAIDSSDAKQAAEHLDLIAKAAEKAKIALADLSKEIHGGVTIQIAGDLCRVDILPVSDHG